MGPGDPEDKEQVLTEDQHLPGRADVRVRCHGCPVQPLDPGLRQADGEVLLVSLVRQRAFQLGAQVRHQAQEDERSPVRCPAQAEADGKPSTRRHPLQAVEVLREGGGAMGQEVVLEDQVQQQVQLIKVSPQEGEAGRVGLCQDLRRVTVDGDASRSLSLVFKLSIETKEKQQGLHSHMCPLTKLQNTSRGFDRQETGGLTFTACLRAGFTASIRDSCARTSKMEGCSLTAVEVR